MVKSPGMNSVVKTATIANGASLSDGVDLSDARAASIIMPAAWTAANLTFQISTDGVTYSDLYDEDGNEYTVSAAAGRAILLPLTEWISINYLKIRSGTSAAAVNQAAERVINIMPVY